MFSTQELIALASLIVGILSSFGLHRARGAFERSDIEGPGVRRKLEDLRRAHFTELRTLIEDEAIQQAPSLIQPGGNLRKMESRDRAVRSLLDRIWDEIVDARKLERDLKHWRFMDMIGRRICEAPTFLLSIAIISFIIDVISPEWGLTWQNWVIVSIVIVGGPAAIAFCIWLRVSLVGGRVTRRIGEPWSGLSLGRRDTNA